MPPRMTTLGEFIIEKQQDFKYSTGEFSRLINSIRLAAKTVNHEVNKAGLVDILGQTGTSNSSGEEQQKLDAYANDVFKTALTNREIICGMKSHLWHEISLVARCLSTQCLGPWLAHVWQMEPKPFST